ncbi:hypothetical protein H257_13708 [Aphanomyces astaci]|uniref:Uncharacterized protein n=1 Tax=Aphanomyces astaci TaxID=112090 RepID=W4FU01_APHAT|nr:hypothetical protein H257_13708 [Aphanomyces astaci]ETV70975.1 hypothetical protein H257_13708 [Aphanomyces astaci]|eukprot:XP_009839638.1 hypothetical protein H257_13708 [Aphanomyces astaci]
MGIAKYNTKCQLRVLIGVNYPRHISNTALYTRCTAESLRCRLLRSRWGLLGHILRCPVDTRPTSPCSGTSAFPSLIFGPAAPSRRCLASSTLIPRPSPTSSSASPRVLNSDPKTVPDELQRLTCLADLQTLRSTPRTGSGGKY